MISILDRFVLFPFFLAREAGTAPVYTDILPKFMKIRPFFIGLAMASLAGSASSQEEIPSNRHPWVDLRTYADTYGRSAGNDLANEVVSRLHQRGDAYDAERTRKLCKMAVGKLLSERILLPFRAFERDKEALVPIGSSVTRTLELALPGGFKWDEDVVIHFKADPANSRTGDPHLPDKMFVWMEFDLSDQITGKGTITVSGAASVKAERKTGPGETEKPPAASEGKTGGK